jgi:phosphoglycerate dehydrogenase-like enzyme
MTRPAFNVALTADFFDGKGQAIYREFGTAVFAAHAHIVQSTFAEHRPVIGPDQIEETQGLVVLTPAVRAESVSRAENLLAIGRFGVGYDSVDVDACTQADVLVFITPGAVDRSVAEATIGWMIALTHQMRAKDELVRTGRWNDRARFMGTELRDRTLGVIGLGGIARTLLRLLESFGMKRPIAFDPYVKPSDAAGIAELVDLEGLMRNSDFVSIHCPLSSQTRGLIGARELAWMKPSAYLLNTARGGIVDEDQLFEVLRERRICGAALDCFTQEPLSHPHRFATLDNVLLAPHAIAWTHELFRDIGHAVCQGMIDLSWGKCPRGVVNPAVLERPGFKAKWQRLGRQPVHPDGVGSAASDA